MSYTYRTDAIHCDEQFDSIEHAVETAIADRDWDRIDSAAEQRYIAEGAWLCVYDDGVPVYTRGQIPA